MPSRRELANAYRHRVISTREAAKRRICQQLLQVDLTANRKVIAAALSDWIDESSSYLAAAQTVAGNSSELYLLGILAIHEAQRLTFGQLGIDPADYVGVSYGRPVADRLSMAATGIYWRLATGMDRQVAMATGVATATRVSRMAVMSTARESLTEGMDKHPQVEGWTRLTASNACAACESDTGIVHSAGVPLNGHPSCSCTSEPVIEGTAEAGQPVDASTDLLEE